MGTRCSVGGAIVDDGGPSNTQIPVDASGALRTVFNILHKWNVSIDDRCSMLGCTRETYGRWVETRQIGDVSDEVVLRLSYILGIWRALYILFNDPKSDSAYSWVHRPNSAALFGNRPPLETMARGDVAGLAAVRTFLDEWCE